MSQRFCAACGSENPFFVKNFSLLSDQTEDLEKLRIEKERIEQELLTKEEAQREFLRVEALRKENEELEILRLEAIAAEQLKREREEREQAEKLLQKEILTVKQETELHKKQTFDMVREVREELQQVEEENRKLKQELELLSRQQPVMQPAEMYRSVAVQSVPHAYPHAAQNENTLQKKSDLQSTVTESDSKGKKRVKWWHTVLLISLIVLSIGFTVSYYQQSSKIAAPSAIESSKPVATVAAITITKKDVLEVESTTSSAETIGEVNTYDTTIVAPLSQKEHHASGHYSNSSLVAMLVGKRLSGCDVTISSKEQIKSITTPVLIEKLASGQLKYKCTLQLQHGKDLYTAIPYLYYDSEGKLLRIDGTNCE